MEIEAKAILTSEKQLAEVEKLLKEKYEVSSGNKLISTDQYYKAAGKTIRIRSADYPDLSIQTTNGNTRHYITSKDKSIVHGAEVNKEFEQEVSSDFLTRIFFPLLSTANAAGPFWKNKSYTQYGYLEPIEKRFYKIDCGYAWRGADIGNKVSYVEIETIDYGLVTGWTHSYGQSIEIIHGMFRTLGIDDLVTEKSWAVILGDTGWVL